MDKEGSFCCVTLYNIGANFIKENDVLSIPNVTTHLENVNINLYSETKEQPPQTLQTSFCNIIIDSFTSILVNGKQMDSSRQSQPSMSISVWF